jgi:hypothetical protein
LECHKIAAEINPRLFPEALNDVANYESVKVFTAKKRIPVRRFHFENAIDRNFQHRNVESATAEIEYRNRLTGPAFDAVRQSGGRRFVHYACNVNACDPSGVFRRLPLSIVEIRGNGNHGGLDG